MRKYGAVIRVGVLSQLQYAGNILGRAVMYALLIFMFTRLWTYLYTQGGSVPIGYTLNQMLWYVVMTELTWFSARPSSVRQDIATDIRSGRIAYILNKPYDYIGYVLSKYTGEIIVNYSLNTVIALGIGLAMIGPLQSFQLFSLPFIAVSFMLSSLVSCGMYLLMALLSFWVEENAPFIWIYEKFVLILGIIFPVEIFPLWAQPVIKASPIYSSVYAPAKMTVDFEINLWLNVTGTQILYVAGAFLLVRLMYRMGSRRLQANGG